MSPTKNVTLLDLGPYAYVELYCMPSKNRSGQGPKRIQQIRTGPIRIYNDLHVQPLSCFQRTAKKTKGTMRSQQRPSRLQCKPKKAKQGPNVRSQHRVPTNMSQHIGQTTPQHKSPTHLEDARPNRVQHGANKGSTELRHIGPT